MSKWDEDTIRHLLAIEVHRCAAELRREARSGGRRLGVWASLHEAALLHRDELACCRPEASDAPRRRSGSGRPPR